MASEEPETQHRMGVDRDTYREFLEWVGEEPDEAKMEYRARGVGEDVLARTTATVGEWQLGGEEMGQDRDHELHYGVPEEIETAVGSADPTDRIEAVETALSALTACINGTIQFNALREGMDVQEVETSVSISVDPQVLFGHADADRASEMLGEPAIEVEIHGDDLDDADREKLADYYRRSPVFDMLTSPHPTEPSVTVHGD